MTLTPETIKDDTLKSGYRHVGLTGSGKYQAQVYGPNKIYANGMEWFGPGRATGEEAAQDYCDYLNGLGVKPPARLKKAGHAGRRDPMDDPEVLHALGVIRDARGQREGRQGYVYLIIEDLPGGGIHYGKLGYSTNPEARVVELQTGNPRPLRLLYAMPGTPADEAALHAKYIEDNALQEWFRVSVEMILEFPVECAADKGKMPHHTITEGTPA